MKTQISLALIGLFALPPAAFAAAPIPRPGATAPVQVMNDDSNPVPVTQSGDWNVELSGIPSVEISNEIDVRDTDNPALQPVTMGYVVASSDSQTLVTNTLPFYVVPEGKRLVIEFFSGRTVFDPQNNTARGSWTLDIFDPGLATTSRHFLGTSGQTGPCSLVQACLIFSQPVKIYANPGASLSMTVGYSLTMPSALGTTGRGTISGHLVDL